MTARKKPQFEPLYEPVLSEKSIAYGYKMASSRETAVEFLKQVGLLTESGELSRNFYPNGS